MVERYPVSYGWERVDYDESRLKIAL
jgi:hypothetical protein